MKTLSLISILLLLFGNITSSQIIPPDSMYLGQTPPDNEPKGFKLAVTPESFAAERIAISNDGSEIYYSEIKSYYPVTGDKVKYYKYENNKWTGPFDLFEGFGPALSASDDTMFVEHDNKMFYSVRYKSEWSQPEVRFNSIDTAHYLQVTHKGNYYVSARSKSSVGLSDWSKIQIKGKDTSAISLGLPINSVFDNLDFYISKDETYMIVSTPFGLSVSYPKKDGYWTNPRGLGSKINFGLGMWGPFVTHDNKYLFYTTGTKPDYSDVNVHWIRIDGLIDSLKHTNIPPYAKNKIKSQSGFVGNLFSFTIPDDTFFDEDGNPTFTYSATLTDGNPLPSWLSFDAVTKTFSGTPTEAGELKILIKATDTGNDSGLGVFKLSVTTKPKE